MKNNLFLLLICPLLLAADAGAQDVHFSQFYESATLRNPALTGIYSGDYRVGVNYRNQWSSFGVPFQTALVTAESKALLRESTNDYLSFGLTTVYDKAGSIDFTSFSAYGAVNYNKALGTGSETYLSVGLSAGYLQRSFDVSKMRFANQYSTGGHNSANGSGENLAFGAVRHLDASAGVSLSGALTSKANYYVGIAGYHLSRPAESYFSESYIRRATRWSGNFGISANLPEGFGLTVHANYQNQYPYQELIGGFLLSHAFFNPDRSRKINLSAGCFYRNQDAIIPTFRVDYDAWILTMSYDITIAAERLYMSGFGGYELSLSMRGSYKHKTDNLMCPRFELLDAQEDGW